MSYIFYTIKLATKDDLNYGIKEITETKNDEPVLSFKVDDADIEPNINSNGFSQFDEILKNFMQKSNTGDSNSGFVVPDNSQALVPVENQEESSQQNEYETTKIVNYPELNFNNY